MDTNATSHEQIKHTPEQKAFYDTFGFLVLRQAYSPQEVQDIERAFEQVITQEAEAAGVGEREQLQEKVVVDPDLFLDGQENRPEYREQREKKFVIEPFCELHPVLRKLTEDDRILGTAEHLLGTGGLRTAGTDGALRAGDTHWHPDEGWGPIIPGGKDDPYRRAHKPMHYVPAIKIAFYLEPLDKDTGCLRVIPGSQKNPFHDQLWSLSRLTAEAIQELPRVRPQLLEMWKRDGGDPKKAEQWFTDPEMNLYGIASPDVPGFAIESQPGDVIFFSHQVWHGSFGSQSGRRMFSINFRIPQNEKQSQ